MSSPAGIVPPALKQVDGPNGLPLAGGSLNYYVPGTTTGKTIWSDRARTTVIAQPVALNSAGRPAVAGVEVDIFGQGTYDVVAKNSGGTLQWREAQYAAAGGDAVWCVGLIADLRALVQRPLSGVCYVTGWSTVGDGGQGIFELRSSSSADNHGTIINDSAGTSDRWYRDTQGDLFDVQWFNAKVDGATDDSTAVQDTFTAAGNTQGVYFPPGRCLMHGVVSTNVGSQITGAGRFLSYIIANHATADILTLNGQFVGLDKIGFDTAVTRSGGNYLKLGASGGWHIENFFMNQYWRGIQFDGPLAQIIEGVMLNGVAGTVGDGSGPGAILVGAVQLSDGQRISDMYIQPLNPANPATFPSWGIMVLQTGDLTMSDNNVVGHGYDLFLVPNNGQLVAAVYAENCFFDTAVQGIVIEPIGTGIVQGCRFTSCWSGTHTQNGVSVLGTPTTCSSHEFIGHQCQNNSQSGIAFLGGTDLKIMGGFFAGQGTAYGIFVAAGVSDFTITNVSSGAYNLNPGNAYGIFIAAGASDRYIVVNNRLHGNTTAAFVDGGAGVNKVVSPNII